MDIIISIIGALTAITVASLGAYFANRNSNILQLRKLKEDHYISYFEALDSLVKANTNKHALNEYTFHRNKLLIIASEDVVKKILKYEKEIKSKKCDFHNEYLTDIVKSIRADLKIKDKNYPIIGLIK